MKNHIYYHLSYITFIMVLWAPTLHAQEQEAVPTKINVKLQENLAARLDNLSSHLTLTGDTAFDLLNKYWRVKNIRRIFPDAGRFEKAHQTFGLNQWFEIEFEDSIHQDVSQLIQLYQQHPSVIKAEPMLQMSLDVIPHQATSFSLEDPQFKDQWHYQNTGQSGGSPEADIKLADAWDITMGDTSVIVAIIDGGIDINHEDLKDALWINKAEMNGKPGVDDDNNGYTDDIHGYGFGDKRANFSPHYHGIHVGGTVGAVTKNGKGVAGIAGGTGKGDGVRLMSCAVFGSYGQGGFPEAFIYAADNGAVIAQNSWNGGQQSEVLEAAIDYFIARAGYDNTEENFDKNIQIGPMAGGIVIFSAGNINSSNPDSGYPGSYESCFAVASTDHHDRKSDFSNYGDWVDIAAPGSNVLSTYTNNSYNYLSGTSMASPHVSGVAALIVSRYGRKGFTSDQVKQLLLESADNLDALNPNYKGMLGAGRLNAFKALNIDNDQIPPADITDFKVDSVTHNSIILTWTATGGDDREGTAAVYDLRYATEAINKDNFEDAIPVPDPPYPKPAGKPEVFEVKGLPSDTDLYFALKAKDYHDLSSGLSNVIHTKTTEPPAMKITPDALSVVLNSGNTLTRKMTIDNTNGKGPLRFEMAIQEKTISEPGMNKKVLVIQDQLSWNLSLKDFLQKEFGITPDVLNYYQIAEKDFIGYDLIITTGDQSYSYYQTLSTYKAKFDEYVKKGGVVQYQLAYNSHVEIAGGVLVRNDMAVYDNLKTLEHTITKDIPTTIRGSYASYGRIENLPQHNIVLTTTMADTLPTTVVYEHGNGEVIATTMPWEKFYSYKEEGEKFLYNATFYALYESKPYRWITIDKEAGTVQAGSSTEVEVTFNAEGLYGGIYQKNLMITSNDPANTNLTIPLEMQVIGAPVIQISSNELDFDSLYTVLSKPDTVTISNTGTDTLTVTSITSNLNDYTVNTTNFRLLPHEDREVVIHFSPKKEGLRNGILTINSNDTKNLSLTITLRGVGVLPPVAQVSPDTIRLQLKQEQKATQHLTISNEKGASTLDWKLNIVSAELLSVTDTYQKKNFSLQAAGDFNHKASPFSSEKMVTSYETQPKIHWLSSTEKEGSLIAATSQQIELMVNTEGLLSGNHSSIIIVHTNDPVTPKIEVPVLLHVLAAEGNNLPPAIADSLKDKTLALQQNAYQINLTDHFYDPEDQLLSFSASSHDVDIIAVSISDNILEIITKKAGQTTVYLTVKDASAQSLSYSFNVNVTATDTLANLAPEALATNHNYSIHVDEYLQLDLDTLFSDPEGEIIQFQFTVSKPAIAGAALIHDNLLKIEPLQPGNVTLAITATDPHNAHIQSSFSIIINSTLSLTGMIEDVTLTLEDSLSFNLAELVTHPSPKQLIYQVNIQDSTVITSSIVDSILTLQPLQTGTTAVQVEITDHEGNMLSLSFTAEVVPVLGLENVIDNKYGLINYPNPIDQQEAVIQYYVLKQGQVTIAVYTTEGTLVKVLLNEEQTIGPKTFRWHTAGMKNGIYLIRLTTREGTESIKVIKLI